MNKIHDFRRKSVLFSGLVLSAGLVFLFWRAKYGYCFNDEPFIVTLAHRLFRGDKLIFDEWHPAQLFGIVLLPLYQLYYAISGSTEGILLFLRYFYCICWFITCVCVYVSLLKYSRLSILCFVYLVLFSPLDYMTCSYVSFGLMGILLLGCLLLQADRHMSRRKKILLGIVSSLLSCVVILSSPFFAIVYILVAAVCLLFYRRFRRSLILLSNLFCTIILGALCFYLFSFRGHSFAELANTLPLIFYDPAHAESFIDKVFRTVASIYRPMLVFYALGCVMLVFYLLLPKIRRYRTVIALYCAAVFLFSRIAIVSQVVEQHSFNYEMFDLSLLGFAGFILLEHKPWKLFACFSCLGVLYALCTFAASNTKLMSLSASMVPCGAAGIIYLFLLAKEMQKEQPDSKSAVAAAVICCMLFCQFSMQLCVRFNRQYWDYPLPYLTQKIKTGAAKGLLTAPQQAEEYEKNVLALSSLLKNVEDSSDGKFLNLTNNPVVYLDADLDYATFSAWTFGYHEKLSERLASYCSMSPDHAPTLIFYTDAEEALTQIFDRDAYQLYTYEEYHLLVKSN